MDAISGPLEEISKRQASRESSGRQKGGLRVLVKLRITARAEPCLAICRGLRARHVHDSPARLDWCSMSYSWREVWADGWREGACGIVVAGMFGCVIRWGQLGWSWALTAERL